MSDISSQLQKYQGRAAATPAEVRQMAAAAWHENNLLLINLNDPAIILSLMDRGLLEAIGIKLYGKREKKL